VLAGLLLTLGLAACTPDPVDPTAECSGNGDVPSGEPGAAEVLLATSRGHVLYADGWMVVPAEDGARATLAAVQVPLMAPPPPTGELWQPAYVGSCQVAGIEAVAAEQLVDGADLGQPMVTDASTTSVTYYGGDAVVRTSAYALGHEGSGDGLSRVQRQGRAVLEGLIAALEEATATGEVLPIETLQVIGEDGAPEPEGWPGPPLDGLLGDDECGELTGQEALDVYEFLSERTHDDVGWLRATVVAPGMSACG